MWTFAASATPRPGQGRNRPSQTEQVYDQSQSQFCLSVLRDRLLDFKAMAHDHKNWTTAPAPAPAPARSCSSTPHTPQTPPAPAPAPALWCSCSSWTPGLWARCPRITVVVSDPYILMYHPVLLCLRALLLIRSEVERM